jgi:hypothetical protein
MALTLAPPVEPAVAEAARRALAAVGRGKAPHGDGGLWWQAGIVDAVEARAVAPAPTAGYSALASPRSTRGATRA